MKRIALFRTLLLSLLPVGVVLGCDGDTGVVGGKLEGGACAVDADCDAGDSGGMTVGTGGRGAGGDTGTSVGNGGRDSGLIDASLDGSADVRPDASDASPEADATDSGDGEVPDPCLSVVCDEPPAAECADADEKRTYEAAGSCVDGLCEYSFSDTECPFGCAEGACNPDPCLGVECETPPENHCEDGGHFVAYDTIGSCNDGECSYESSVIECSCENDACTIDPCDSVTCDDPPQPSCIDSNTRRTYAGAGTCSEGSCSYAPTDTDCPYGCEGGACADDPCLGVTCNTPPAASCANGTTLRTYAPTGTCRDGTCTYARTNTVCSMMCTVVGTPGCRCASGYEGTGVGPGGCTDIDECATDNGGCGDATYWECENEIGAPPTCTDIDECATKNGQCGNRAHWECENEIGAPPTCTDINECSLGTDDCDTRPRAACRNTAGGFNCRCPSPSSGNGHGEAGCTCPAEPACDASGERNGSYCQDPTTVVTCARTNTCHVATSVACESPAECVGVHPNARCERAYGNSTTDSPNLNYVIVAGRMLAVPFTLTEPITLTHIGALVKVYSTVGRVRFAVYEGSTVPTTWKATAFAEAFEQERSTFPISEPATSVRLAAGTYWIVITAEDRLSIVVRSDSTRWLIKDWDPWDKPFPAGSLAPMVENNSFTPAAYVTGIP